MRSLCGVQPLRGEDAVTASVRKMSNQEADDCATLIVEMFDQMCKTHVNAARPEHRGAIASGGSRAARIRRSGADRQQLIQSSLKSIESQRVDS